MSSEGRIVGGRYRLDRRIGSGAMGVVWQAYDERLRRAVAVKQLRLEPGLDPAEAEEARERAMREGRIAARLHHPNAVSVFDVVDEDDAPWLVMEYVPSRSLAAEMSERGVLQPEEVGRIGAQVAHALVAAHAAGIVHRDIKPANVLLGDNGTVKITDFGISRATGDVAVTKTGLIAGTPAYLAPEVAYGRPPEAPSDVFSLGSTLYAAVEGVPPFGLSENTLSLLHTVAAGQTTPPRQAGILTDVLIRLLDADPETRPDAQTAARWLDAVARGDRPDIRLPGPTTRAIMAAPTAVTTGPVADAAHTQKLTPVGGYRTAAAPRPPMGAPRRNRRPLVLAGVGVTAAAALATLLLVSGALRGGSHPTPTPVDSTHQPTTTTQQTTFTTFDEPTTVPSFTHHSRPPVPTTTETTTETTTTPETTTTEPPTTTTAQPTSSKPSTTTKPPSSTSSPQPAGNVRP